MSQSRTDSNDFIPILNEFNQFYDYYSKNACADSGYGSLENYEFLNKNYIGNFVKYFSWEKQNRNYIRIRRRGMTKVSTESMLILLGLNIRKLLSYYETNKSLKF